MGVLYKLDFANGKSYIGITTKTAKQRFSGHKAQCCRGTDLPLYNAWRKHGEPTLTTLAVLEDADLAAAEIRAIKAFGTLAPNGYNLSFGGQTAPGLNPETAAKISKALKGRESPMKGVAGKKHTDEAKAKMAAAKLGKPGRKHTDESKQKISKATTGRVFSEVSRKRMSDAKMGRKQA